MTRKTAPSTKPTAKKAAAKAAPAKAPAAPATAPAADAAEPPLVTHEHILKSLPSPDPSLRPALTQLRSAEELLGLGQRVRSAHVLTDGDRIVSAAFHGLTGSGDEVQAALAQAGVTASLVVVTTGVLQELDRANRATTAAVFTSSATRGAVEQRFAAADVRVKALRDAAWNVLFFVTGADEVLRAKLDAVSKVGDNGDALSTQLTQLAGVAEAALLHKGDAVAALLTLRGVTDAAPAAWRQAAGERTAAEQASRALPQNAATSQSDLDRLDGLCLILLREVFRGMELAKRSAPALRVPRLYALQNFLGRSARSVAAPAPAPADSQPAPV